MLSGKMTLRLSEASAIHWREMAGTAGAGVIGRRLFDLSHGWGGDSPTGEPVFVVTHSVPQGWKDRDTTVPYLSGLGGPVDLEGPIATLQGNGVTHLRYRIAR